VVRLHDGLIHLFGQQAHAGVLAERRRLAADEATLACGRGDDALALELGVGLGDRVAIDAQVLGERPNRRQGIAGLGRARRDGGFDLVDQLQVDRLTGLVIQLKLHGSLS
jgi:hypothetical protein